MLLFTLRVVFYPIKTSISPLNTKVTFFIHHPVLDQYFGCKVKEKSELSEQIQVCMLRQSFMAIWLYPISKNAGRYFELTNGKLVDVSVEDYINLVKSRQFAQRQWWYVTLRYPTPEGGRRRRKG
jgi:hypothetical protein